MTLELCTECAPAFVAPPADLDAEAVVLSEILTHRGAPLGDVHALLKPHHFYADANRRIYEAMLSIAETGTALDVVTVAAKLREMGRLEQVGGSPYLAMLLDSIPAGDVKEHARIVRERYTARETLAALRVAVVELESGKPTTDVLNGLREACGRARL